MNKKKTEEKIKEKTEEIPKKKTIPQSKYFCGIINNQNEKPEFTKKQVEKAFLFLPKSNHYSIILHDKDYLDTGELKRKHFHFTCESVAKMTDKGFRGELQKSLSNSAGFSVSEDVLTTSFCSSIVSYKRYLIHQDDSHESGEKVAYQPEEVITNDSSSFYSALEGIAKGFLTYDQLSNLIKKSERKSDVFKKIGLENSQRYLALINCLYDEKRSSKNDDFIKAINHTKRLIDGGEN